MAWKSIARENKRSQQKALKMAKGTYRLSLKPECSPSAQLPAASRPVAQLPQDSYLGKALRNVNRANPGKCSPPGSDSYGSSSSPSSSEEEGSSSEDSSSSQENHRCHDNQHGRDGHQKKKSHRKLVIKPIAPKEYNGRRQ